MEEPAQGHLSGGRSKVFGNLGQRTFSGGKGRTLLHRVGPQRPVRHKSDPFASAVIHDRICLVLKDAVAVLDRSDLGNLPHLFKLFQRDIGKADQPNFPFLLKSSQTQDGLP